MSRNTKPVTGSSRRGSSDAILACSLCQKIGNVKKLRPMKARNLKRHIKGVHEDLIILRANKFGITREQATQDTYENIITLPDWPEDLLKEYFEKIHKGSMQNYFPIKRKAEIKLSSPVKNVSDDQNASNEEKELGSNLQEMNNAENEMESREKQKLNLQESEADKFIDENQPPLPSDGDFNQLNNEKKRSRSNIEDNKKNMPKNKVQTVLTPASCTTCDNINGYVACTQKLFSNIMDYCEEIRKTCKHKNKNKCCCNEKIKLLEEEFLAKDLSKENIQAKENKIIEEDDEVAGNFFAKNIKGNPRWFCEICHKYNHSLSPRLYNDWHHKGQLKRSTWELKDCMKKHLKSEKHKEYKKTSLLDGSIYSLMTDELASKTTENLCIAGQFSADHNMTQRFHPQQCDFLNAINENLGPDAKAKVHPLGNVHHGKMDIKESQKACFLAKVDQMKNEDMTIFPPTNQLPRYHLAYDKGTAVKDSTRQPIVMGKIDYNTGIPKEYLIAASVIPRGGAEGALDHITSETKKIISTERVAFTSSDREPLYDGKISGVSARMKSDENYSSNVIHLPDTCHCIEKMTFPPPSKYKEHVKEEQWVLDTCKKAQQVVGLVLSHPKMTTVLRQYSEENIEDNVRFHTFQPFMNVRFSEYLSRSLHSILKNLNLMIKVLPDIASEDSSHDSLTRDVAAQILTIIQDSLFIARIILLDKVFYPISVLEKSAQSEDFGPFEYIQIKEDLKRRLEAAKNCDEKEIENIVENGLFEFHYMYRKKKRTVKIDLNEINLPEKPSRTIPMTGEQCWEQFLKWVDNIAKRLDIYMDVPNCMSLVVCIFSVPDAEITPEQYDDRLGDLRKLFKLANTEFEKCGENCDGYEDCKCLNDQLKRFLEHVLQRKEERKDKYVVNGKVDYIELYKFYLCEMNFDIVKTLKITNIVRALEICMLMKASQSSTERIVSQIKRTVRGRFENISRFGKVKEDDMVNINVFLRTNSGIDTMDAKLAAKKYREELKHRPSLKKSKPLTEPSLTLKNMWKKKKTKSKKPKPCMQMSSVKLFTIKEMKERDQSQRRKESNPQERYKRKLEKFQHVDLISESNNKDEIDKNSDATEEKENIHKLSDDEILELPENISKSQGIDIDYELLHEKVCIDDCKNPDEEEFEWIGCDANFEKYGIEMCKSLQLRFQDGFKWGDWFHDVCVRVEYDEKKDFLCTLCRKEYEEKGNLKPNIFGKQRKMKKSESATDKVKGSQNNVPKTDLKDYVHERQSTIEKSVKSTQVKGTQYRKSESCRTILKKQLLQEGRALYNVKGDGDCFFASAAVVMWGDVELHWKARLQMYDLLETIYKKHKDKILTHRVAEEEAEENPELYFVYKLIQQSYTITEFDCAKEDRTKYISDEQMQMYINKRKHSCNVTVNDEINWGNNLDEQLFSFMQQKNLFVIREFITEEGGVVGYKMELQSSYDFKEHKKGDQSREYHIILYEVSGRHFTPIISSSFSPRPDSGKMYGFIEESPRPVSGKMHTSIEEIIHLDE